MRIVDCFSKTFAYTLFLVRNLGETQPTLEIAAQELDRLLEEGRAMAKHSGFADEDFDQARFAVVAWVDEAILVSEWEGRMEWAGRQLQRRLYHTANAGEEFFVRLEKIPSEKRQVLEVYAMCLSLGFIGRYFHESHLDQLNQIKQASLGRLWSPKAMEEAFPGDIAFPEAYPSTLVSHRASRAWSRFDPFLLVLCFLPPALLITMFLVYRFILNRNIFEFLRLSAG